MYYILLLLFFLEKVISNKNLKSMVSEKNLQSLIKKKNLEIVQEIGIKKSDLKFYNLKQVHGEIIPKVSHFECPVCGLYFTNVKNHLKVHTKERPFQCDICKKKFIQKINLTVHHRVHTGERPYKCKKCDKTFIQKGNLDAHVNKHHKKVEEFFKSLKKKS